MVLTLRLTPRWLARRTSALSVILLCGPVGDGRDNPAFADAKNADQAGVAKRTGWEIDRDFALDLVKIRQPLLVLMGERDRFVPNLNKEVERLRDLLIDHPASVETIPNAGHIFLPSAAVALAAEKIAAFLEQA
jgi:pimeloyl-ACP methyl ester carboxylesterase